MTTRLPAPLADRRRIGLGALLLGSVASVAAVLAVTLMVAAPARGGTGVELMVYSGRANPSFELTPAEVDELERRLGDLPPGGPPSEAPGLGYRGLLVTLASPSDGADQMTVYRGAVRLETEDVVDTRLDTASIESWLLDLARQRGHADLVASLE
ncbi:MAG TPA: hypothetical protein VEZ42_03115 [Pseudonocardia sp.]|nr:hypothetical protein [Pseudonocardia sp.]